jgi:large subunit ribosomal protein L6
MSRIGKKPVPVPAGVKVSVNPQTRVVNVEGPKGKLSMTHRPEVSVAWSDSEKAVTCSIPQEKIEDRQVRAYWGMTRALINSMVEGALKGYERKLEINGVGWGAKVQGQKVVLNVGYANAIEVPIPAGVKVEVNQNQVLISGPDKQAVGELASSIRSKRKPEPYNGKGIKYSDEVIIRKQGKAFGS